MTLRKLPSLREFSGKTASLSGQLACLPNPLTPESLAQMTQRHRRRARASEPAAEALLALSRTALDGAAQGICVFDADSRVVLFNRAYIELFNLSADVIRSGLS